VGCVQLRVADHLRAGTVFRKDRGESTTTQSREPYLFQSLSALGDIPHGPTDALSLEGDMRNVDAAGQVIADLQQSAHRRVSAVISIFQSPERRQIQDIEGLVASCQRPLSAMLTIKTLGIDLAPPLPASAGCYAQASLRRLRSGLGGRVSADDLATLTGSDVPGSVL
jgi:hypothetical protein